MVEITGLGDCGLCNKPIAQGTPIWTTVIHGTPKVCHKECKGEQMPTMVVGVSTDAPDFTKPATGAAPPQPMWMRGAPVPVPPMTDPPLREGRDRDHLEALIAALQASPNHAWIVVPGPTDLAGPLASDILDWLSTNGWTLRRKPSKKS